MFFYAANHPVKKASYIKNSQNLTPLSLAAKLGRKDLFLSILEQQKIVNKIIPTLVYYNSLISI